MCMLDGASTQVYWLLPDPDHHLPVHKAPNAVLDSLWSVLLSQTLEPPCSLLRLLKIEQFGAED